MKGWLLLCLYIMTSWRLPSADFRSIGGWIKFSLLLIMLLGERGFETASSLKWQRAGCTASCHSLPAGFYWYLSNPVSLPYIAHPTVQAGAWCTVLAAAAVHKRSDMVSNEEILCVAAAVQSKLCCILLPANMDRFKCNTRLGKCGAKQHLPDHGEEALQALRYLNKTPTKHLVTQGPYAIHR